MASDVDKQAIIDSYAATVAALDRAAARARSLARRIDRIHLVGCGGPNRAMLPVEYWIEHFSPAIEVRRYFPAEYMRLSPKRLDGRTLVILGSKSGVTPETVQAADVETNLVRCPDAGAAEKMIELIEKTRQAGDTVGGVVLGVARGVPPGWGEPVFDRLEADLAKAMLSLPASKGFDIGSGFAGIRLTGTQHNDAFRAHDGKVYTPTNRSGGVQGGISNGQTIYFRVAFKPVATVMVEQDTVDTAYQNTTIKARGRHDPCVLPRAVPIVEAMTALVLVDHALRQKAQCGA